jgi:hypothetical protein
VGTIVCTQLGENIRDVVLDRGFSVQELVNALRTAGADDPRTLSAQLKNATDECARATRELDLPRPPSSYNYPGKRKLILS